MLVLGSHSSKLREKRLSDGINTGQPTLFNRWAADVIAHAFVELVGSDLVDDATTEVITAAAHNALVGDLVHFTDGVNSGIFATVVAKTTNTFTLGITLDEAPTASDGFEILRYRPCLIGSDGSIQVAVTTSPVPKVSDLTTETIVPVTDVSTTLLNANADRIGGWVKNISAIDIYVSFSDVATTSKPTKLIPGASLSFAGPQYIYTGKVTAINSSGSTPRNMEVVEL